MAEPTLLFCVGATKSGTGWLYDYLASHPECHFRSIKELHYFNALDMGRLDREISRHDARRQSLEKRVRSKKGNALVEDVLRLRDRTDWLSVLARGDDTAAYLSYLGGGRGAERVIGDVTPAYSLLSEARLVAMSRLARDVKFVYLVRDPVERLWSHVRMMAARRDENGQLSPERAARILRRTLRGEESQISRRSDYAGNIARMRRAVGSRLLVAFYEELFAGDAVAQICEHVGIEPRPAAAGHVVHPGPPLAMTAEQRYAMKDWLAPQYEYVANTKGHLPPGWQQ